MVEELMKLFCKTILHLEIHFWTYKVPNLVVLKQIICICDYGYLLHSNEEHMPKSNQLTVVSNIRTRFSKSDFDIPDFNKIASNHMNFLYNPWPTISLLNLSVTLIDGQTWQYSLDRDVKGSFWVTWWSNREVSPFYMDIFRKGTTNREMDRFTPIPTRGGGVSGADKFNGNSPNRRLSEEGCRHSFWRVASQPIRNSFLLSSQEILIVCNLEIRWRK